MYTQSSIHTSRIVLQVETVEAVEGVVSMHVQRVDAEVVGCEVQRHEHLSQSEEAAVAEDHRLVGVLLELMFDEAQ